MSHFNEEGQILVPVDANVEYIIEAPEVAQPFPCTFCKYRTTSPAKLSKHLKSHHQCTECGKSFKRSQGSRDYKRHLKTHQFDHLKQTEKPKFDSFHKCSYCQNSFSHQTF